MKTLRFLAVLAIAGFLASCAGPETATTSSRAPAASERAATREQYARAPQDRPGLGTKWGETRISRVASTAFDRASKQPLAVAAINYNNAAGIRAMAGAVEGRRTWPQLRSPAGSLVSVGLRDQSGAFLPGTSIGTVGLSSAKRVAVIPLSFATEAPCVSKSSFLWTDLTLSTAARLPFESAVI